MLGCVFQNEKFIHFLVNFEPKNSDSWILSRLNSRLQHNSINVLKHYLSYKNDVYTDRKKSFMRIW